MTLHHDAILQHPDRLVLDPDLLRKHLAHERFIPVPLHPPLVRVAIARAEGIHADAALRAAAVHAIDVVGTAQRGLVIGIGRGQGGAVAELLPGAQRAAVRGVDDDADALVGGGEDVEADEEQREGEEPPPARFVREDEEDGED